MILPKKSKIWFYSKRVKYDFTQKEKNMILRQNRQIWLYAKIRKIWFYPKREKYDFTQKEIIWLFAKI